MTAERQTTPMLTNSIRSLAALAAVLTIAACAPADAAPAAETTAPDLGTTAAVLTLADTILATTVQANGVAAPIREATLSTKLMGAVIAVPVLEGSTVRAGQQLVRIDARDLAAKREQVSANQSAATAMHAQAVAHAARMRALFADDAAPKSMLEAAEAGLAQAESGLRAANAAATELSAIASYADVTAPFAGVVTQRFVDPGALAAPGAPLLTVQDASALRLTVHVSPRAVRGLRVGEQVAVTIEGVPDIAIIEGIVPAQGGLHAVNALVNNRDGRHLAGSSATVAIRSGTHRGIAVPESALIREGDLVGVVLRTAHGDVRRWIRTGAVSDGMVEVIAGLRAGDQVVLGASAGVE
jgi:RND family efflux transporter MFP subunit